MIERRAAHLRRCFRLVALSLGAPSAWLACATHGATSPAPGDDSADSSVDPVAEGGAAAPFDSGEAAAAEAGHIGDAGGSATCGSSLSSVLDGSGPDGEELCDFVFPCGLGPAQLTTVGCQVVPAATDGAPTDPASIGFPTCHLVEGKGCVDGGYAAPEAGVEFVCIGCPGGGGRRPAGFELDRGARANALGAYFAELAQLEAGAARAFVTLARELEAHGAPPALVAAARACVADEARHARMMDRIARKFGAVPPKAAIRDVGARSLAALAKENAIEGCVRETFGALLNVWQAAHAADEDVRSAMSAIARDELRHAALAWEIAAWADSALAPSARRANARSRRRAIARLAATAAAEREASPAFRALVGLPTSAEWRGLVEGLTERLWAAA